MAKVPMQFFILFIGAMVFVVFIFERPPLLFGANIIGPFQIQDRTRAFSEERALVHRRQKSRAPAGSAAFGSTFRGAPEIVPASR